MTFKHPIDKIIQEELATALRKAGLGTAIVLDLLYWMEEGRPLDADENSRLRNALIPLNNELTSLMNSWHDTLDDEDVLDMIQTYNRTGSIFAVRHEEA